MTRHINLVRWAGSIAALALFVSSCGGGGGSGGESGNTGGHTSSGDTSTSPTPLRAGASRNEVTRASDAGSITLRVQSTYVYGTETIAFSVFLLDGSGNPAANQRITVSAPGMQVGGLESSSAGGEGGTGITGSDGSMSGTVTGISGGRFTLTAAADSSSPFDGLSATLTMLVLAPTAALEPTMTPTPLPCVGAQTMIVQTDTLNVSSQAGGTAKITAVVFDADNLPVADVNVLFDVSPRVASFAQLVQVTDQNGIAATELNIPPNSSFGSIDVSASACGGRVTSDVTINIVSGVSTKPVKAVVLQADPSTIGTLSGGTINLSAAVFDTDNLPIDGIDVLFVTTIGKVNPLTDRTEVSGSQGGIATSLLIVPVGAIEKSYTVTAIAGGISGATTITVVPGHGVPGGITQGVPPGEPAAISLGASPPGLQVAGTGGTELATITGRVFDNNGNPLSGVRVHYHVVSGQSAPGAVILPVTTAAPEGSPTPIPTTKCAPDDPVAVSDNAGFALIQLRSGPQPGPVTVAACADTIINDEPAALTEQQVVVVIISGPVSHITATINARLVDNNDGTLLTTVSAIVTDAQGNTVQDGTPVYFEILGGNDGIGISSNSVTDGLPPCDTSQFITQTGRPITSQPGDAIACLKFAANQQGTEVLVRASSGGVVNNQAGQQLLIPGFIGDLEASLNPSTVTVTSAEDGLAILTVTAFDPELAPLPNVRVRFTTSIGSIDRSILTDENGEATATLLIPAGTSSDTAKVRVSGGGLLIPDISVPIVNVGGGETPTPTVSGQPAAIQFLGASPATIGVHGSGLPEQSVLTFQVTDSVGQPVSGQSVQFALNRISDENISPKQAITDSDGKVQVTLTSGERALSIQITAQVITVTPPLTTRSTPVNILGGPPSQPNFSLAAEFLNVSGGVFFGTQDKITAFVADRFGNPVPPGTAVNFTTKGGAIGNQSQTDALGQATATLVTQEPVPADGNVDVLATTRGERPFIDTNGNGICDDGQDQLQMIPEPFYDINHNGVRDPDEDFIDLNGNGVWDADQSAGLPTCADPMVLFYNFPITFSGHTALVVLPSDSQTVNAGGFQDFTVIVSDNPDPVGNPGIGNPIVGGSKLDVSISGGRGKIIGLSSLTLGDAQTFDDLVEGINRFHLSVIDKEPTAPSSEVDELIITVTSDVNSLPAGGNGTRTVHVPITFLGQPTPTPPVTATPTPPVTVTPTPAPPAIVPPQAILSAGTGAPPTGCNGPTQTFVVTGGSPPFNVFGGGGCVSASSVPASGGSFVFTAGNTVGNFSLTITDALGRTASAGIIIQGPPTPTATVTPIPTNTPLPTLTPNPSVTPPPTPGAAFVRLDQILTHVTNNQDGTFTTILSTLATDANGVVMGDGVPVEFSLVNPVPGASLTSPGYTNRPQPCTIDFAVVIQPGDALSCLKYVAGLQGTTVMVRARVQTATGTFVEDVRPIVLIDTRPTATPTITLTPTVAPSATPTVQMPMIAPGAVTLFAGVGAPPNCRGTSQVFTVTGGAPPFTLSAGGAGCLSTTSVPISGGSVIFTAGNTPGTFVMTATDAQGQIATAEVTTQAPAVFIKVDLLANVRSDNGDATFSSVLSALVTDANGVVVPDGIPVEFSIVPTSPTPGIPAGISVTSPGYTHAPPPCTLGFPVVPQPGDALSCIKYVQSLQGSTVTIRAQVASPGGTISDTETITLPDTRSTPTRTPTFTPTITSTPPPTETFTPFPTGQATYTATTGPTPTATVPVGSLAFISAQPATIGVRASGLPEQSVVTFQAKDTLAQPIPGAVVRFVLTGSGTELVDPVEASTDNDGFVSTTVTSGTRATTIRVTAEADSNGDGTPDIFMQSQVVSILGAPPAFNHFSVGPLKHNIAGRVTYGLQDPISAFVNDRFGNAVPPATSVSFVTNAASVVNPTTTSTAGVATATLLSEGIVPPTGIITILAFTRGEESFLDNNGNGGFDCLGDLKPPCPGRPAGDTVLTDDTDEPHIDFRPLPPSLALPLGLPNDSSCTVTAPNSLCNNAFDADKPFELFVDNPPPDGVWAKQGATGVWDNNIFVWSTTTVTFSGPLAAPQAFKLDGTHCEAGFGAGNCYAFDLAGQEIITVTVHDDLFNPLVAGSLITFKGSNGLAVTPSSIVIPDGQSYNQLVEGLTTFTVALSDGFIGDPLADVPRDTSLTMTVTSDNGGGTFLIAKGTIGK